MPGKLALPAFFAVILVGAVVLGPAIYFLMQAVWPIPFHRAMDRALLISALAGLALVGPRLDFRALWPWQRKTALLGLLGLFVAAISMQAIVGVDLAVVGFHSAHLGAGAVAGRFALALVAAIIAAPAEETVFRGFLQREFVRGLGWTPGWVLGAAVYALAHFLKVPVELDHQPVSWASGAGALVAAFAAIAHDLATPENQVKLLNLLIIGLILGGVYQRSGSLWFGGGLHAGWILGLLLFTGLTRPDEPPRVAGLGGDITSSLITTVVLLMLAFWLWRYFLNPSVRPESGASAP
jgi:membrane protease YdiL (CAAX protease family)